MVLRLLDSPLYAPVLGVLCGLVGFRLGWRLRHRALVPLAQTVLGALAFGSSWQAAGLEAGAVAVAAWAVGSTLASVTYFLAQPTRVDASVVRAAPYRADMLAWLRSGRGFDGVTTARRHARELAVYVAAALLTGNVLGIALGALLLNQMNAWVAAAIRAARRPVVVVLLAWNVWSLVRVAAYVALGAACAAPLGRLVGLAAAPGEVRRLVAIGVAGVALDLVLKLTLSGAAGRALAAAMDLDRLGPAAIVGDSSHPEIPHGSS